MRRPLFAFLLVACGSDPTTSDSTTIADATPADITIASDTTSAADTATVTDAATEVAPVSCDPPGFSGNEAQVTAPSVDATIVNDLGAPVEALYAIICGVDLCTDSQHSDASGHVAVANSLTQHRASFVYGDGFDYPRLQVALPGGLTNLSLTTAAFPANGAALTAGTVASAGVELTITPDTDVLIDELTFDTPAHQAFRAVALDATKQGPVLGELDADLVYGLTPTGTTFCPPVAFSLPNTKAWPAGASVLVFLQGNDTGQAWAPFGEWQQVATASVSADGTRIVSAPGSGLPMLGALAFRRQ